MEYEYFIKTKEYLIRFDEILEQMSNKMLNVKIVNNITINFIICMIPHHQAAIYMSKNLLNYTRYKPLQNIAKNIITMQEKGISEMQEIIKSTCGYESSKFDVNTYMEKYFEITKNMINKMQNSKRIIDINIDFVSEMIPHHEGAVKMCNNLLKYRIDPRLEKVAKSIIREQSKGIIELKQIEKLLYKNT